MLENAAVLWTGGKDSSLALYEAKSLGYEIKVLATFAPKNPRFLAHPVGFIKTQAKALGIPHRTLEVDEPFREGYENAIPSLRREYGVDTIVTGDIWEVDCHPNWIRECCRRSGVNILTPLWTYDRRKLINKLISNKFKAIFSCVRKPYFTADWLGRGLDKNSLKELLALSAKTGFDISGEQGEYHTLVLDGPPFKKAIQIDEYSKEENNSMIYLNIRKTRLKNKHK